MTLYFNYESQDTLKSLSFFLTVKTITSLYLGHSDNLEIKSSKNKPLWFTFSRQCRIRSFHVVVLQRTTRKCTMNHNVIRAQLPGKGLLYNKKRF